MRPVKKSVWTSEAAMLCWLRDTLRGFGAEVYGEAAGHDMIVVATAKFIDRCTLRGSRGRLVDDMEPGDLIAVEGKLRASFHLLDQALPPNHPSPWGQRHGCVGADFYMVCIPEAPEGFIEIAAALGIGVFVAEPDRDVLAYGTRTVPAPAEIRRCHPPTRCVGLNRPPLPTLAVEVTPGLPSPMPLTGWKIGAVRLCLLAAERPITREDFRREGIDHRRFVDSRWMVCEGRGKEAVFRLAGPPHPYRPDLIYRDIAAALRAQGAA